MTTMLGTIVNPCDVEHVPSIEHVDESITATDLLECKGWFFLADIFKVLDPKGSGQYKLAFKQMEKLNAKGVDVRAVTGRVKLGGRVAIKMEKFAAWYRNNPLFHLRCLPADMDFKVFFNQGHGNYRLSSVCNRFDAQLPLSYLSFKRMADRTDHSRHQIGIYKYQSTYLVQMPTFAHWIRAQLNNVS